MQAQVYTIIDEYGVYKSARPGKVVEEPGVGDGPDAGFALYPPDLEAGEQVAYSAPPTDEPGKWVYDDGIWLELTTEKKAELIRQQRDALLSATDYRMMPDYPMSELCRENLKLYRQLLRDIPEQPGFPDEVAWPEKA